MFWIYELILAKYWYFNRSKSDIGKLNIDLFLTYQKHKVHTLLDFSFKFQVFIEQVILLSPISPLPKSLPKIFGQHFDNNAQRKTVSIKKIFSKCEQIRSFPNFPADPQKNLNNCFLNYIYIYIYIYIYQILFCFRSNYPCVVNTRLL